MSRLPYLLFLALALIAPASGQWTELLPGGRLDGWEPLGDGIWTVMRDGTLVGQRDTVKNKPNLDWTQPEYQSWLNTQAWLYTRRDFGQFDLHLEYWLRYGGNSGVSLRDTSRAQHAISNPPDFRRTPARIGYEIQLSNHYPDQYPSGSIYTFAKAVAGAHIDDDWNSLDIEVRDSGIKVKLNGTLVAEHAGDPKRSLTGPIGLQLHDQNSVAMFRNIRVREVPK